MANMTFKANLLPNEDLGYELGSSAKRWKVHGEVQPLVSKVYESTSQIGTGNNDTSTNFYLMSVRPDSWNVPWKIRFKLHSYCPSYLDRNSITWCTLSGRADAMIYHNWNEQINTGHYYIATHILKKAGFDAGLGHAVGAGLRYASNYTSAAYYRTFEVDLYEAENCTVTFLDASVLWANWTNGTDTNYGGYSSYDAYNRGLRETGDDNETGRLYGHSGYLVNGSNFRLAPYSIFGLDRNNNTQGISLYSVDYTSATVTASISTTHSYNTAGFDWTKGLFYTNSGTNFAKGANVNCSPAYYYYAADFRYTDNCVALSASSTLGIVQRKPVYFKGVIKEDGLFYLKPFNVTYNNATYSRVWTQDIPTSVETDGTYQYTYWLVGYPYYNSSYATAGYLINMMHDGGMYWFHNNRFEEYTPASSVAWSDITGKPSTFTPSSHTHGNITNDGKIGSTADYAVYTTTGGAVTASSFAVSSPTSSGSATLFIATVSQDSKGKISATKAALPVASTLVAGIIQIGTGATNAAAGNHTHGNIANNGTISASATVANSDRLVIMDSSDSNKITTSTISFGTATTTYLRNDGTWATPTNTDTKVNQTITTTAAEYRVLLSGTADDTTRAEGANKSTNLRFNPSTKLLSIGGSVSATGSLTLAGAATFNDLVYAESLNANSLLVNGNANFVTIPTAPTPANTSNDTSIATTAFVKNAFGVVDAMVFKGALAATSSGISTPAANKGDVYKVSANGKINGQVVEIGDTLICTEDNTAAGTTANWVILQTNIDGAVTGPASTTDGKVALFSGTSGKVIKAGTPATATVIKTITFNGGTTPSLGTAFSVPNVTGNSTVTAVTGITQSASTSSTVATVANGVLTIISKAITTVGSVTISSSAATSKITLGTAFSIPNITGVGTTATLTTTTLTVVTGIS